MAAVGSSNLLYGLSGANADFNEHILTRQCGHAIELWLCDLNTVEFIKS
jgi:hypothetical protein